METKKVILVVVIIGVVAAGLWFLLGSQFGVGTFLTQKQPKVQSEAQPYYADQNTVVIPPEIADRVIVMTDRGEEKYNDFVLRSGNNRNPGEGEIPREAPDLSCVPSAAGGNISCVPQGGGCTTCRMSFYLLDESGTGGFHHAVWGVHCWCDE